MTVSAKRSNRRIEKQKMWTKFRERLMNKINKWMILLFFFWCMTKRTVRTEIPIQYTNIYINYGLRSVLSVITSLFGWVWVRICIMMTENEEQKKEQQHQKYRSILSIEQKEIDRHRKHIINGILFPSSSPYVCFQKNLHHRCCIA